ncbi:ATP-binding protein [Mycobacterium intracellulare]|uniref:ATP-binding protein n=1 Tax=Mycobacterium TaxID=1763 RepID=UPI002FDCCFFB|nr:AAA family ATPase [Mycobacterium intracellulare]
MVISSGPMCARCHTELRTDARFCDRCGAPVTSVAAAEFKQLTVLLADVVHSMDVATALGAERLREILSELFERWTEIIRRYGGTVDKFTGDGVMALFGAPDALEDHAFRACLTALAIQRATKYVAAEIASRDGVALHVRVGVNSGRVIAGDIGSGPHNYTAIGDQVGLAQRMETAAPPAGVMLSASTARLVEHRVVLGPTEMVLVKGAVDPLPARLLIGIGPRPRIGRPESALVGRDSEVGELTAMLDAAICGSGCIAEVVGVAGIGKSRLVRETARIAMSRGAEVFATVCEAHTREIAFHAASVLLRAIFRVGGLDEVSARAKIRAELPTEEAQDVLLLDDLLGIRGAVDEPTDIDPDARRRRLLRLLTTYTLQRQEPAMYVIEDAQWIDDVSEAILADLIAVLRSTRSLVVITHRREYVGALATIAGLRSISLPPLDNGQSSALMTELLGSHDSTAELAVQIAERAAGNPFFAEEIVQDFAERGVLSGDYGNYVCLVDAAEINVPVTVEATISARIDRLSAPAKRTLNAAAVIGSRFEVDLLEKVLDDPRLAELVDAGLVERVTSTASDEYMLRYPLIRTVVYESQLQSRRSQLHRQVAVALQDRAPSVANEHAALIAMHLEAANDLRGAFEWYMRAAELLIYRDIRAARRSWQHAHELANQLPTTDAERTRLRVLPLTLLCATAWRVGASFEDAAFDELKALTAVTHDSRSLVTAMSGHLIAMTFQTRVPEASRLASDYVNLLESIGDDVLTVALLHGAVFAKWQAGEALEAERLAQRVIDLASGSPAMGNMLVGSPLALAIAARGAARSSLGQPGWKGDFDAAIDMARAFDPTSRVLTVMYKTVSIGNGLLLPDEAILRETAEILELAERSGDDLTLANACMARGIVLVHLDDPAERQRGFNLFNLVRQAASREKVTVMAVWFFDILAAREQIRLGNPDEAIALICRAVEDELRSGEMVYLGLATTVLVEALLSRNAPGDLTAAKAAAARLAAVPTDPGFVLNDIALLRARTLLVRAYGTPSRFVEDVSRYHAAAIAYGFDGHAAAASAMI